MVRVPVGPAGHYYRSISLRPVAYGSQAPRSLRDGAVTLSCCSPTMSTLGLSPSLTPARWGRCPFPHQTLENSSHHTFPISAGPVLCGDRVFASSQHLVTAFSRVHVYLVFLRKVHGCRSPLYMPKAPGQHPEKRTTMTGGARYDSLSALRSREGSKLLIRGLEQPALAESRNCRTGSDADASGKRGPARPSHLQPSSEPRPQAWV